MTRLSGFIGACARAGGLAAALLIAVAAAVGVHAAVTGAFGEQGEAGWQLPFILAALIAAPMLAAPYLLIVRQPRAGEPRSQTSAPAMAPRGTAASMTASTTANTQTIDSDDDLADGYLFGGTVAISAYYLVMVVGIALFAWAELPRLDRFREGLPLPPGVLYTMFAVPLVFVIAVLTLHLGTLAAGRALNRGR